MFPNTPLQHQELYDSTVHTLEMTKAPDGGSSRGQDDVKVQSIDGMVEKLGMRQPE